ncbi:MAG: flippase [Longimicrobiales bacterium]
MNGQRRAPAPSGVLLARNTVWNLIGLGLPLVVALVAIPLLVRRLGAEAFGFVALVWMLLSFVSEIGFGRAGTKYAAELLGRGEVGGVPRLAWTTAAAQLALAAVIGLALALTAEPLVVRTFGGAPELRAAAQRSLWWVAAAMPVVLVGTAFRSVLEAAQRFDLVNLIRVPLAVGNMLLPLAAVALGLGLVGITVLLLLGRAAGTAAYAIAASRVVPGLARYRSPALGELRTVLAFGAWTTVTSVVSPILVYVDRFVIAAAIGVAALGYYAPAYELSSRVLLVPAALVGALFPALSAAAGALDAERVGWLAARSLKYILLALGPVVVLLVAAGPEVLQLWLGSEFALQSGLALRILAVGILANGLAHVLFSLLQGIGRADVVAKFHVLELPVHLGLTWYLVRRYGIAGAAAAWTLRVTLDVALLFAASVRLSSLSLRRLLAERVPQIGMLVAGFAALGTATIELNAARSAIGVLGLELLVLVLLLWKSLERVERDRLARALRPA